MRVRFERDEFPEIVVNAGDWSEARYADGTSERVATGPGSVLTIPVRIEDGLVTGPRIVNIGGGGAGGSGRRKAAVSGGGANWTPAPGTTTQHVATGPGGSYCPECDRRSQQDQ